METSRFDIADYLDSNEMVAEYLNAVLADISGFFFGFAVANKWSTSSKKPFKSISTMC